MRVFDRTWFVRHQAILLWLVNTPLVRVWFRWVLCLTERRPILELTPHSFTVHESGLTVTTDFRTHPKYAKRLYHAFYPLWRVMHLWDLLADPFLPALSFGFATLGPVWPDAGDPGAVSGDTEAFRAGVDETWATIIAGAGTGYNATAVESQVVGFRGSTTASQWARLYRSLYHFDTSGLTSGATISAAVFSLRGTEKQDQSGSTPDVNVYQSTVSSNNTFSNAAFQSIGTTAFATAISYASWSTTAYNDFTLNASGLAAISKTSVTKFATKNANKDAAAVAPTWGSDQFSYLNANCADLTGTTSDPKLVVTYTVAGGSSIGARLQRRSADQTVVRSGA